MKNILVVLIFTVSFSLTAQAQEGKAELLKEPAAWSFERFDLPPAFAATIPFKGVEELRFSPGMFNKDSADYFTYAFVAQLDGTTSISQSDIRNYLLDYFKGLCSATARDRNLLVDTSKISVFEEKKKGTGTDEVIYNAVLNVFGVFADGAPVKLIVEVKVLMNAAAKKTYLIFIASPHEKTDYVWKELYNIQKNFVMPI
ncbi:MAG: hypothetical protein ABIN93_17800 [Ginsengibacter sp.]